MKAHLLLVVDRQLVIFRIQPGNDLKLEVNPAGRCSRHKNRHMKIKNNLSETALTGTGNTIGT